MRSCLLLFALGFLCFSSCDATLSHFFKWLPFSGRIQVNEKVIHVGRHVIEPEYEEYPTNYDTQPPGAAYGGPQKVPYPPVSSLKPIPMLFGVANFAPQYESYGQMPPPQYESYGQMPSPAYGQQEYSVNSAGGEGGYQVNPSPIESKPYYKSNGPQYSPPVEYQPEQQPENKYPGPQQAPYQEPVTDAYGNQLPAPPSVEYQPENQPENQYQGPPEAPSQEPITDAYGNQPPAPPSVEYQPENQYPNQPQAPYQEEQVPQQPNQPYGNEGPAQPASQYPGSSVTNAHYQTKAEPAPVPNYETYGSKIPSPQYEQTNVPQGPNQPYGNEHLVPPASQYQHTSAPYADYAPPQTTVSDLYPPKYQTPEATPSPQTMVDYAYRPPQEAYGPVQPKYQTPEVTPSPQTVVDYAYRPPQEAYGPVQPKYQTPEVTPSPQTVVNYAYRPPQEAYGPVQPKYQTPEVTPSPQTVVDYAYRPPQEAYGPVQPKYQTPEVTPSPQTMVDYAYRPLQETYGPVQPKPYNQINTRTGDRPAEHSGPLVASGREERAPYQEPPPSFRSLQMKRYNEIASSDSNYPVVMISNVMQKLNQQNSQKHFSDLTSSSDQSASFPSNSETFNPSESQTINVIVNQSSSLPLDSIDSNVTFTETNRPENETLADKEMNLVFDDNDQEEAIVLKEEVDEEAVVPEKEPLLPKTNASLPNESKPSVSVKNLFKLFRESKRQPESNSTLNTLHNIIKSHQ